jgi:hypothetical protein
VARGCNENNAKDVVDLFVEQGDIMKKIILTVFLLSSLMMACRKSNGPAAKFDLGVDLQATFEEDQVQVLIDNQLLYDNLATTNHSLSLAKSIGTTNTDGTHHITVVVNNKTTVIDYFEQHSNLYIGVSYDKDLKKVSFRYSPTRFVYD